MGDLQPRTAKPFQKLPGLMVCTDAATSAQIICALVVPLDQFVSTHTISECITMTTGKRWKTIFNKTNYIYGIEMLDALALAIGPKARIDGKSIVFYLGNDNAVKFLVKNKSDTRAINVMTLLIWHMIAIRGSEHGSNGRNQTTTRRIRQPVSNPFRPMWRSSTNSGT